MVDGGLSHLQYAEHTVIMLHYSLMPYYEAMSGMHINYEKSEIFTIGLTEEEQNLAANCLGCKNGVLPMKYLGMLVSSSKISNSQLIYVSDKSEKRLGTWQCEYLSTGGRSILIDSCLSSIPMYTMRVYQLYEGNFQLLDSIRSRFYW